MGLNDEEKLAIYQKGLVEGQKHQTPSPDTVSFIRETRDFIIGYGKDIEFIKEKVSKLDTFEKDFVKNEIFNEKISSLKTEIKIYVGIGMFAVYILKDIIFEKVLK